ncbi:MATE family efflux transporter [Blautia massiliensis (ex Durand et al. 2017)]|uniref:MATE family efflux transporter n=1 Tax=Blautia massiliensis (ex Durand et al. 2017) TaxID=1737424 RepID=UPI0022DFFF24|nr:MATE family efflux transporter [Blautia massiliensis (ex Durand et al. 2017)]
MDTVKYDFSRLFRCMQRAERGEELTIGFFGGSITQGKILKPLTNLVSSFAMGTTVLLGQQIGCGERKKGGRTVGTAIVMFGVIALIMTVVLVIFAPQVSSIMNAPEEAFDKTVDYVRICW